MNSIFCYENMAILPTYCYDDFALMNSYCFWNTALHYSWMCSTSKHIKDPWEGTFTEEIKPIIWRSQKKLIIEKLDFDSNISTLLSEINGFIDDYKIIVQRRKKNSANVWRSNRRSVYTGVFKNGDNWQAFISIKKRKTYLGTFSNQEDAAKTFDFYSMLLNRLTAKTNFDYSKKEIMEMIEKFMLNGKIFD